MIDGDKKERTEKNESKIMSKNVYMYTNNEDVLRQTGMIKKRDRLLSINIRVGIFVIH